jgi:two-component system CheB/CheR fusion protein
MRQSKPIASSASAGDRVARKWGGSFPIVALGASAGGLEAFEQFFRHVPADSGMAFVLVPHLDPTHSSILAEILQRSATMPVVEAQDRMAVVPNCVYVIPPNHDMAIFHGALQLRVPELPRGQRMPIDAFLRSLAEDQGELAIGVILSGTGTDGTLGLRAILGAGGVSMVQEPATAKYDGMPTSAIRAGYAMQVLPAEKMPEALLAGVHTLATHQDVPTAPAAPGGLNRILMLLRTGTGHDFAHYKKSTIARRIERRMSQHHIEDTEVYARYLEEHPVEVRLLFKELLINVTSFFRDPDAFVTLKQDILPRLFDGKPEDYVFRVWVVGCSTGEEAYSIAMLIREFMDEARQEWKVQLYSTDLDDDAIAAARAGVYPRNIAQDVSPERLRRFFVTEDANYRVKKEIREMVVFAVHNVIKDPPFTKLDLLSCRNLLIYLEPELQSRILPAFHYALRPGGALFLSPSESAGNHPELFAPLNRKWKFYQAVHAAASPRAVMAARLNWAASGAKLPEDAMQKSKETNFAELTRRALLQSFAPASVVTNVNGDILYVHGETGKYLRPAPGHATLNAVEMAREGLQLALRAAVLAASQGKPTVGQEVSVKTNGDDQCVSLSVRLLPDPEANQTLLLMSFQDVATVAHRKRSRGRRTLGSTGTGRVEELERELADTKENLQATIEEQQAANEALKATNEEMQSTNEELQSANEELETAKEELQSLNEELATVNAELQASIEQLTGMQNDLKNLLDNINVGTVFLDQHLIIRRFTREAAQVYHLVASDAGRPLRDIKCDLEGEDLLAAAQAVLDSLIPYEREARAAGGAWYLARIHPYRTLDNAIDGVVLTFTDIGKRVAAEAMANEARDLAEGIVNTVREPLLILDSALQVVCASRSFYRAFQVVPEDTVGRPICELGNRQWDIPALRRLLENVVLGDQDIESYEVEHDFPAIGHRKMLLNARRIVDRTGSTQMILLAMEEASPVPAREAAA